mgnify:CR=1 FL=1
MLTLLQGTVLAVALLRLAELIHANRNTTRLIARGGVEFGQKHYPLFVLLHGSWLVCLLLLVPADATGNIVLLALFGLLQFCRLWVILSLGPYWTTRVISAPDFPLVKHGPYRLMKHPNYAVVCAEIAVLPLAFGAWELALLFSALNAALLCWRIRIESAALAARRGDTSEIVC